MNDHLEQSGILLKQALPYINKYRSKNFIFVIPASLIKVDDKEYGVWRDISACCSLGIGCILVIDYPFPYEEGYAVSKDEIDFLTQDIATLEFKCRALLSKAAYSYGHKANIISGSWVLAQPRGVIKGKDMQRCGKVRAIEANNMQSYLDNGNIVVHGGVAPDKQGQLYLLNTNDIVINTSLTMSVDKIILYLDCLANEYRHKALDIFKAKNLLQASKSLPLDLHKLLVDAVYYCNKGVNRTHIIPFNEDNVLFKEILTSNGCGMMINSDSYEKLVTAKEADIEDIKLLIEPLVASGKLRPRSQEHLLANIGNFCIIKQDNNIVGCAALSPLKDKKDYMELECVVVKESHTNHGYGKRLLNSMEKIAMEQGYKNLVVFTTQAATWFEEAGYTITSNEFTLPTFCKERNSKTLVKKLL